MNTMKTTEDIKEEVRGKYAEIAHQDRAGNAASCCGSGGCSTEVYNIMTDDYAGLKGYVPDADLGLGCGLPTQFAGIKPGDTVLDLGSGAGRDVYALARHANRDAPRIPAGSISKPPSAELAPGQKDEDALPPYPVLDEVLHQAIELGLPGDEIEPPHGATRETVAWILRQIDRNEYKRRQAPVVLRVSQKAYGSGRRVPIVHRSGWGI